MDSDDRQIGRILRRREVLALLGAAGGAALLSQTGLFDRASAQEQLGQLTPPVALAQAPTCVVKPELTEGPYFVDAQLDRSDIRSEASDGALRPGVPLELVLHLSQVGAEGCAALPGARVDVWHCDALGVYSGVTDNTFPASTLGQRFLRGYQTTDADGVVRFQTIYPGWYSGRAVHAHFKIRTIGADGGAYEFTSQFFFDEHVTDQVHALPPYVDKGQRTLRNDGDGIFRQGGNELLLQPVATADGGGYQASFALGLDLSDAAGAAADGMAQGARGGPGGPRPPRR
jgi:protocatechuate 3,4-dioxygenase beta subunit